MNNRILPKIANEVQAVTEYLSQRFCDGVKTDLAAICQDENISLIYAEYRNHFDGMIVWDTPRFYIHINTEKGNLPDSNRGRFSLGHELGHYFLESHRAGIRSGIIPPHASVNCLVQDDKLELEADYFAANLLMPRERLRRFTGGRKFSLDIIKEISAKFGVSLTAAVIRFAEVGTHEIMVVFSQDNVVKWSYRSENFPKVVNKFKKGGPLPPTSVAGESFLKRNARYTGVEPVDFEDWFIYNDWKPQWQLYEQCCYSDIYNYVISIVWFK